MSYATLSYARDEGITTEQANDGRLQRLLDEASAFIDRATGWWFEARTKTLAFDGDDGECLWMPAPVIALTSVAIDGIALDLAAVLTYGAVASGEHLRAARLALASASYVDAQLGSPTWPAGRRNITVVGSFGYVLPDGTTPPPEIRDLCLRLALRNLPRLADAAGQSERRRSEVFRESTDGHSYELAGVLSGAVGAWRRGGITGDPDIDLVLAQFRRPSRGGVLA